MTRQHPYIPATEAEEEAMLATIGVTSFEELIHIIPADLRLRADLDLPPSKSEVELVAELSRLAERNRPAGARTSFLGGGVYDHYPPEAVPAIAMRSEFYTAYTPYQAEVSQGTLQVMYEFQTMICEISGLEVANASLYDGASAAAEACSMALGITGRQRILLPETVTAATREVVATHLQNRDAELITIASRDGRVDLADLKAQSAEAAAVVVQAPNCLGRVEGLAAVGQDLAADHTCVIAAGDAPPLGLLESPGLAGADIYVGEGQSLGIPMSFGGPYLGLMSAKSKYVRRMPGRIVGRTTDQKGRPGFVMVLRTREQDIRREKATSNICTNQGLLALWATVYLSLLGRDGLTRLARLCFDRSQYLGRAIDALPGYTLPFGFGYVKELVVRPPVPAGELLSSAAKEGFLLGTVEWQGERFLQMAVTEKRTRADMDRLVAFLAANS